MTQQSQEEEEEGENVKPITYGFAVGKNNSSKFSIKAGFKILLDIEIGFLSTALRIFHPPNPISDRPRTGDQSLILRGSNSAVFSPDPLLAPLRSQGNGRGGGGVGGGVHQAGGVAV